jgi:outer membrane lipoprotein SlyB
MTVGIVIVGSAVVCVTTVGIVVGTAVGSVVGTVVGSGVGTAVGSVVGIVVGSVTGEVVFPPITSADTETVQIVHSIRNMIKNRSFTVSLPIL